MAQYRAAGERRRPLILFVSYHPPEELPPGRRLQTLREEFHSLGITTLVLTTNAFGRSGEDGGNGVVRVPDVRPRRRIALPSPGTRRPMRDLRRHPLSRLVVPDLTAATWLPVAATRALALMRHRRPHAVFTTSPPESPHLIGALLRRLGLPWVADLRDGWTFESPVLRPYAAGLDRGLERRVLSRADALTAATPRLVADLSDRFGQRVVHLPNAVDFRRLDAATDERQNLDPARFSLVYTGTGRADGKDPRAFLSALAGLLEASPNLRNRLEVVFAGNFTAEEVSAMEEPPLDGVVRWLGRLSHPRALGLQRAADGLLFLATPGASSVTTGKVYEYLATAKPILAFAAGTDAQPLLERAGGHVIRSPSDSASLEEGLRSYLDVWLGSNGRTVQRPPLDELDARPVARRLVDLFAELGVLERKA